MLINFTLTPIQEVAPWGSPENPSLSWFGLTDGHYWIEAGSSTLFEYTRETCPPGSTQYCYYQVARLYEDLLDILPHILEPVPASLAPYISGESAAAWEKTFDRWREECGDHVSEDRYWEVRTFVADWKYNRHLNSMYLSPPANITIWSDAECVHIEWDNREYLIDGQPAWTAIRGSHKLTISDFITEIESFHARLMSQMESRVDQVAAGAHSEKNKIDPAALAEQHKQSRYPIQTTLRTKPETDWLKIEKTIREVQSDIAQLR